MAERRTPRHPIHDHSGFNQGGPLSASALPPVTGIGDELPASELIGLTPVLTASNDAGGQDILDVHRITGLPGAGDPASLDLEGNAILSSDDNIEINAGLSGTGNLYIAATTNVNVEADDFLNLTGTEGVNIDAGEDSNVIVDADALIRLRGVEGVWIETAKVVANIGGDLGSVDQALVSDGSGVVWGTAAGGRTIPGPPGEDGDDGAMGPPGVAGPPGADAPPGGAPAGSLATDTIIGNGVTTVFALTQTSSTAWALVTVNGAELLPSAFTVSGATITFGTAPADLAEGLVTYVYGAVTIIGPQGYEGDEGPEGQMGPPGIQGPTGAAGGIGATGTTGDTGPIGLMGPPGSDGDDGLDGIPGIQGVVGATGATGDTGATGADGAQGSQGYVGPSGDDGDDGYDGIPGLAGSAGPQGLPGFGSDGADGDEGPMGPPGLANITDPVQGAYAPGWVNVPTGWYAIMVKRLIMTGTQRATLAGTARLRIT